MVGIVTHTKLPKGVNYHIRGHLISIVIIIINLLLSLLLFFASSSELVVLLKTTQKIIHMALNQSESRSNH